MTYANKVMVNFTGGEVSPLMLARTDLPLAQRVLSRMENFIAEIVGPARFRNGFRYVGTTKNNNKAVFIEFQFSDVQSYLIEATEGYFRFYKDGGIILDGGGQPYEVKTPYLEEDLEELQYTQNADTMYITHRKYAPRKLTRSGHASWSLVRYSRQGTPGDPFETDNVTYGVITGVTQASPGVVSDAGHTFQNDDHVYISGIVGMTELNDRHFTIYNAGAGTYSLKDYETGVAVDTTAYTAWSSGGVVELVDPQRAAGQIYPGAAGFTDDARLQMAGTTAKPETTWFSKNPTTAGAVQFDDFRTGTADTDGVTFTLAPLRGRVDSIRWIANTDKYIAVGTFGSVRRLYGETEAAPITPTAITAKAVNADGVKLSRPVVDGSTLFYIKRGGLSIEAIEYNYQIDGYEPTDQGVLAPHLLEAGIKQIVRQVGQPTMLWAVREDGRLLGYTYKASEKVAAWHQHTIGGNGLVEWLGIMPRENNQDQLWAIIRREIGGQTVRYVEYMEDAIDFPDPIEFFSGVDNETIDRNRYENRLSELQKLSVHLDSALTYDGSDYGRDAGASLTVGVDANVEGTEDVIFTASASVFTADMVGRQIWGAYDEDGAGGGRAEITAYDSGTQVRCTIVDEFWGENTVYAAGDWYITATEISGLDHLEGLEVGICADGGAPESRAVDGGTITLDGPASVAHIGLPYVGIMRTLPLDQGGTSGPAQSKMKNVAKVAIRFVNSAGVKFGTSLYNLQQVELRPGNFVVDRPIPLVNRVEEVRYSDNWQREKVLFVVQDSPFPTIVAGLDIYTETADE